jgi:predicted flap endonuclease-1-like 5' DNA nuclease
MSPTSDISSSDLPNIGGPATRALAGAGITQLQQLTRWSEADLAKLHGVGPKAVRILREALRERGLAFAEATTPGQ